MKEAVCLKIQANGLLSITRCELSGLPGYGRLEQLDKQRGHRHGCWRTQKSNPTHFRFDALPDRYAVV